MHAVTWLKVHLAVVADVVDVARKIDKRIVEYSFWVKTLSDEGLGVFF